MLNERRCEVISIWVWVHVWAERASKHWALAIMSSVVISWMGSTRWKSEIQIIIFESRYAGRAALPWGCSPGKRRQEQQQQQQQLSAKNGHLALLEDIRHGWLALSRGSSNHHLHATTPMSSLANGFTFRLSNVSLLKMMKTSLPASTLSLAQLRSSR